MRFGIVAEGPTEFEVAEAVLSILEPTAEVERVWPDMTQSGGRSYGWLGVRSWCEENGAQLVEILRGVKGREIDALIIHLDCSMAHNLGLAQPCPPAEATAAELRSAVCGWLNASAANWLVLMTPSMSTEAWFLAALASPPAAMECCDAEAELVARKHFRRKDGQVKKPAKARQDLVRQLKGAWHVVRAGCDQAARFDLALRDALVAVAAGQGIQ